MKLGIIQGSNSGLQVHGWNTWLVFHAITRRAAAADENTGILHTMKVQEESQEKDKSEQVDPYLHYVYQETLYAQGRCGSHLFGSVSSLGVLLQSFHVMKVPCGWKGTWVVFGKLIHLISNNVITVSNTRDPLLHRVMWDVLFDPHFEEITRSYHMT